ncbi:hypothetical protein P7K49_030250, partial [Saguinus oedipus]
EGWTADGGAVQKAREGLKEGAGASGTPSCCTLQEVVGGGSTTPMQCLNPAVQKERRAGQTGSQRRRLVLDAAAETPRRLNAESEA